MIGKMLNKNLDGMFKLKLTAQAKKQIKQLTQIYQKEEINKILTDLKENPFVGKALRDDLEGRYTYKVGFYCLLFSC
jgi:mRNA-degrading endonuclease RelE of RelBE toxin-antitoxin system